jgi:Flp pilus assembly pilin Flp
MWWRIGAVYLELLTLLRLQAARFGQEGRRLARGEAGQSTVEYAVVAALIVIASMATIQVFGQGITTVFQNIVRRVQGIG